MKISLIVAMDREGAIGRNNKLPWRLPRELAYVKQTTMGCPIIMGRKNFESIGRALPGRRNIILTRDESFAVKDCEIAHSIDGVFELCKAEDEVFIFGGEQIYKQFLPFVEKMYVTKIEHTFKGDTFFPVTDFSDWDEVSVKPGVTDEQNPYTYHYYIYEKR